MKEKHGNVLIDEFTSPLPYLGTEDMSALAAFNLMQKEGIRHLPIVRGSKPIGIISERDLAFICGVENGENWPLSRCMIENPYCVTSGSSLDEVALEMSRRKIGSALVVAPTGELDGIFTSTDGLNALIEVLRGEVENFQ